MKQQIHGKNQCCRCPISANLIAHLCMKLFMLYVCKKYK